MDNRAKYKTATLFLAVGFGLALLGFSRIQSEASSGDFSAMTFVLLLGGAATGLVAAICRTYWKHKNENDSRKAEIDAFAILGRQNMEERDKKIQGNGRAVPNDKPARESLKNQN